MSGQGTRTIVLGDYKDQITNKVELQIDLEVQGGPPELVYEKSCHLNINPVCSLEPMFAQYGRISLSEEHEYLDRLAARLKQDRDSTAYIVAYAGKNACVYEASRRAGRARQYLIETHNLPTQRVIAVEGGFRDSWAVDLFVQPTGACGPLPSPKLSRAQVQVKGQCADK